MPELTTIGLFAFASLLFALLPGPDLLYIATRSVAQGRYAGVMSAIGVQTGTVIHTFAAAAGLSALVAASAVALSIVKYAGAAYLLYLGIRTFLTEAEALQIKAGEHQRASAAYYQGLMTNVLNPKVILFFLAFLPQFVDPTRGPVSVQLLVLGLVLAIVALPVNVGIGLAGGVIGSWLHARRGVQEASKWASGLVYIALGIGTAVTGLRR